MNRERLISFVRPLYHELDGVSRMDDVERISDIARRLHKPATESEERMFELLLVFQRLGSWLGRMGNVSRTALALQGEVSEGEIRAVGEQLRRLSDPREPAERALAAARLVDAAGVTALAERIAHGRREGLAPLDIAREALAETREVAEWIPGEAREWIAARRLRRDQFCEALLRETALGDL